MAAGDALLMAAGAACAMANAQSVDLPGDQIRLMDVISLDCIAEAHRDPMGQLSIASAGRTREFTRSALAQLIRRRAPALSGVDLSGAPDAIIRLHPPPREPARAVACYAARNPINAGAAISAPDVERASCPTLSGARAALRYDAVHGVTRAVDNVAAGDPLGRILAPPADVTETGEALTLRIAVGPVIVERQVEAVQSSSGGAVFVRDADGNVFSAPVNTEDAR